MKCSHTKFLIINVFIPYFLHITGRTPYTTVNILALKCIKAKCGHCLNCYICWHQYRQRKTNQVYVFNMPPITNLTFTITIWNQEKIKVSLPRPFFTEIGKDFHCNFQKLKLWYHFKVFLERKHNLE